MHDQGRVQLGTHTDLLFMKAVKIPTKKEIIDSLTHYYELKTVLNDTEVDVVLVYLDGKENPEPKTR